MNSTANMSCAIYYFAYLTKKRPYGVIMFINDMRRIILSVMVGLYTATSRLKFDVDPP